MAKVTVLESTPSQAAIAKASQSHVVTDARGRKITLKKPTVLTQYRFVEMLGASAENQTYMGMALPLLYIIQIDEHPRSAPSTKLQLEALIISLDEDGINAVMQGVQEHFGATSVESELEAAKK